MLISALHSLALGALVLRAPHARLCDDAPIVDAGADTASSPPLKQPIGIHLGVVCDRTLNPITGYRYTRAGSNPSYDLCQAEFEKLSPAEAENFERLEPQLTPRRAILGLGVTAALLQLVLGCS